MKAIVHETYGPPEVLELRDIAKPLIGDDDVLIRVHAAGLDPSVWHLMTGLPYLVRIMGYGLRKPKNPVRGSDVAGVVEAVGKNVSRFRPGDEVFGTCRGAFAEYAPARADTLLPKPGNLTLEQAAAVPVSRLQPGGLCCRPGAVRPRPRPGGQSTGVTPQARPHPAAEGRACRRRRRRAVDRGRGGVTDVARAVTVRAPEGPLGDGDDTPGRSADTERAH